MTPKVAEFMPLQPQQPPHQQQQAQQLQEYSQQQQATNDVYNSDYNGFGMRSGPQQQQQQQQQHQNSWGALTDDMANPYGQPPPQNHTMAAAAMGMLPPQGQNSMLSLCMQGY